MASIAKSSKAFVQFKLGQYNCKSIILRHNFFDKVTSFGNSSCETWHNYSSNSFRKLLTHSTVRKNIKLPVYSLSAQRHISSNSNSENLQVFITEPIKKDPGISQSAAENVTSKVVFVNTPPAADSPPVPAESFSTAANNSFISDAAANTVLSSDLPSDAAVNAVLSSDLSSVAAAVAEPSLSSLGLVNWTPVGLIQACLEYLHINMHLPWWVTIVTATVIVRALMFPIFVKAQRNSSRMANYMPEMQFLQAKFTEARKTGNAYEASKASQDLITFMKKNDVNPLKNMLIPLSQAPVFLSFFLALRSMAKVPVESMRTGGISWITDLTVPDPYYILPLISCSTVYLIFKIGAESGMRMDDMKIAKYVLKAVPIIIFPFCINFESAVLFYWCTSNFISLGMALMMKAEGARKFFNIPKMKLPEKMFVKDKKGFIESIKESVDNQKILNAIEDRRRIDRVQFQKAGTGPIPRTYSYDPTKPRPGSAAAAAKQRQTDA